MCCANYFSSTRAILLARLASTSFPSGVAIMLRTTPPPEGIFQGLEFFGAGIKAHQRIGADARLAVPDYIVEGRDAVRL